MPPAVISALITSIIGFIGVCITVVAASKRQTRQLNAQLAPELADIKVEMAVLNTKIEDLTKSVEKHNGFAQRIPKLETQEGYLEHRVEILERKNEGR